MRSLIRYNSHPSIFSEKLHDWLKSQCTLWKMILPPPRLLPLHARPVRFMKSKTEQQTQCKACHAWHEKSTREKFKLTARWPEVFHRGSSNDDNDDAMILMLRTTIVMVRVRTKYKLTELPAGEENTSTEPVKVVPWKPDNHHYLISFAMMIVVV